MKKDIVEYYLNGKYIDNIELKHVDMRKEEE